VVVEAVISAVALAVPVAVTALTAEDTDKEVARLQTADGLIPLGAAVAADAVAHSIPGKKARREKIRNWMRRACGVLPPALAVINWGRVLAHRVSP
jgi:hypothetical protein